MLAVGLWWVLVGLWWAFVGFLFPSYRHLVTLLVRYLCILLMVGFWWASGRLLVGFVAFGELLVYSPDGGHLVGFWWASGEV